MFELITLSKQKMKNFEFFFLSIISLLSFKELWFEDHQENWRILAYKATITVLQSDAPYLVDRLYEFYDFLCKSQQADHPFYCFNDDENQFFAFCLFYNFSKERLQSNLPAFRIPPSVLAKSDNFVRYCFSDKFKFSNLSFNDKRNVRILEFSQNQDFVNFIRLFSNFKQRPILLSFVAIMNFQSQKMVYEIVKHCNYTEISFLLKIFKRDQQLTNLIQKVEENKFLKIHNYLNNGFYDIALGQIQNVSQKSISIDCEESDSHSE